MNRLSTTVIVFVLGALVACPASRASFTRDFVSKGSQLEKELGLKITVTPNEETSGMGGTVTVEVHAPKTPKLQDLSRIILLIHEGKVMTGRFPLELQKGKAGENLCYFQLTPEFAKEAVLELVCPTPGMPNGVIYEVDLSGYVPAEGC